MSALLALLLAAQSPVIVAHRGLSEGAPENSLTAFRRSVERGIAVIELDVRTTKDGRLVILHDETLDRTTDCSGRLADFPLDRLHGCKVGDGDRIPTLVDALRFVGGQPARLLLDIKPGTPLRQVIREIREQNAELKVILGLRRASDIARVRRDLPGAATLAFMPKADDAPAFAGAHIVRLWSDWVEADSALVTRTRAIGPQVWIMIGKRLPAKKGDWRTLHARMIATGAEGLITDRPELISSR